MEEHVARGSLSFAPPSFGRSFEGRKGRIYTPVERTLIEAGRFEAVEKTRTAFQETMRPEFTRIVEEFTGRKVVVFLSQVHVDPDVAVETFMLEPHQNGA